MTSWRDSGYRSAIKNDSSAILQSNDASAIQVVRPLESIAETQPQLHPALLRLSAMISQYFTRT